MPSARMAPGHSDSGLHDDRLHDVGQDVADEDAEIGGSEGARGFDVFALAGGQHLGADQAGVADPSADDEGQDEVPQAGAEKGDEGDGQQDTGEREKRVHHDDVDEAVDPSAVVSGERADEGAEQERSGDHRAADDHGVAGSVEDAGEQVAAQFVGAAEVVQAGRLEADGEVDEGGIARGEERAEDGAEDKDEDERDAE